jgi:hypothetical protein
MYGVGGTSSDPTEDSLVTITTLAASNANEALKRTTMNIKDIFTDIFSSANNLRNIIKYWGTGGKLANLVGVYTTTSPQFNEGNKYRITNNTTIDFEQGQMKLDTIFYINSCEVIGVNTKHRYKITPINNIQYTTTTITLPDGTTGTFQTPRTDAMFGVFNEAGSNKSISTDINISNITTGTNIRTTITLRYSTITNSN